MARWRVNAMEASLTCAGAAVGVVGGVGCGPVAPEAGVAFTVGAGGVARGPAELRGAAARADGPVAWQEPTPN